MFSDRAQDMSRDELLQVIDAMETNVKALSDHFNHSLIDLDPGSEEYSHTINMFLGTCAALQVMGFAVNETKGKR